MLDERRAVLVEKVTQFDVSEIHLAFLYASSPLLSYKNPLRDVWCMAVAANNWPLASRPNTLETHENDPSYNVPNLSTQLSEALVAGDWVLWNRTIRSCQGGGCVLARLFVFEENGNESKQSTFYRCTNLKVFDRENGRPRRRHRHSLTLVYGNRMLSVAVANKSETKQPGTKKTKLA